MDADPHDEFGFSLNGGVKVTDEHLNSFKPVGDRIGVTIDGCDLFVSTVVADGVQWTRVEAYECETIHYQGHIGADDAARRYMDGQ